MRKVDPLTSIAIVIIALVICGLYVAKGYVVSRLEERPHRKNTNQGWKALKDHWWMHPQESEELPDERNVVTFWR